MPCATPPWIWPSTIIGLITVPISSTAQKPDDLDLAGLGIDLELTDMRAVAEGEIRRIVDRGLLQPGSSVSSGKLCGRRRRAQPP